MFRHSNFAAIAEKNAALLERINFDPSLDDPFELDSPDVFRATRLFPDEAIDAIFSSKEPEPTPCSERVSPRIGMVLLRPDMVHIACQVEEFVGRRFQLIDTQTVSITPEIYWAMYGDAMVGRETAQSRLTRAAIYINSPCRLFLFEQSETSENLQPAADEMFANYKGRQGVHQADTLRGEVVYNAALETGFHTLADMDTAMIADPFGAYRKIIRERTVSPCHRLKYPLLFFTGVGIHIPDYQEMQRDLSLITGKTYAQDLAYASK